MRSPTLAELPPPPPDKAGWPWTEESPQLPDGETYLGISIVTPSLNQGRFIEETIRSVLLQGYPDLEYIIIDGGSTDGTVEIIQKYEKWLAFWVSEPDKGQSHAVNKGVSIAKGDIIGWLNSDDLYLLGTFEIVNRSFSHEPDMVFGDCHVINENNEVIKIRDVPQTFDVNRLISEDNIIMQPSTFFKRSVFEEVGGLDESLEFAMDYDLWIRIGFKYTVQRINAHLSCLRKHSHAKTYKLNNTLQYHENLKIRKKYGGIKQSYQYYRHFVIDRLLYKTILLFL